MESENFSTWAMVELFGKTKLYGLVSEHKFGNESMMKVDVPATSNVIAWSKLLNVKAIFAINPMSEKDAKLGAERIKAMPLDVWDTEELFKSRINELVKNGNLVKPELQEGEIVEPLF